MIVPGSPLPGHWKNPGLTRAGADAVTPVSHWSLLALVSISRASCLPVSLNKVRAGAVRAVTAALVTLMKEERR